ncbi:hybrid sensor histidine kinase/response regulator [Miltoncostaea oceani]|uniref:hybrid sensor histidine kinase/response regulator n=1 Tax=Miltoncostaea oceani TaxID=2843216 RepID=UPI001C3C496F|nr:hybrid sensor histidine kinase/response regulator [Miltoncostaea oceani]
MREPVNGDDHALLRTAAHLGRVGGWAIHLPGREVYWSEQIFEILDWPSPEQAALPEALDLYVPPHRDAVDAAVERCAADGTPFDLEVEMRTAAGRSVWARVVGAAERDASGVIVRLAGALQDITGQRRAAALLAASEERFRYIAHAAADAIWDWDLATDDVWWSAGMRTLFGHEIGEVATVEGSWTSRIHPDDLGRVVSGVEAVIAGGDGEWMDEYRFLRSDGTYATVTDRGLVIRDDAGTPVRMVGGMRDVTEARARQERQRQSQRLEALGQLTGGVAHDFNNLLTVILGNSELLRSDLARWPELQELATMSAEAARRGADLTRGLLAFARRQPLTPSAVDVNALVRGMEPMLRRALGPGVAVVPDLAEGLPPARVDASQLEIALLNLAINARDAMPRGGRLTISTSAAPAAEGAPGQPAAGDAVVVRVADTGVGIVPEDLGRVFDPFFTTKEAGGGSGLGLSMVYGFAAQSQGHVTIASEPGRGTTVGLHLPRDAAAAPPAAPPPPPPAPPRGAEGVLVVDDEALVRRYAGEQLRALGYRVRVAADGAEALAVLRGRDPVELLFTDLGMPGMDGRTLAGAALRLRPGLRVLLTSGGADLEDGDVGDDGPAVLPKPYGGAELAAAVRAVLDTPVRRGASSPSAGAPSPHAARRSG